MLLVLVITDNSDNLTKLKFKLEIPILYHKLLRLLLLNKLIQYAELYIILVNVERWKFQKLQSGK